MKTIQTAYYDVSTYSYSVCNETESHVKTVFYLKVHSLDCVNHDCEAG